MYNPFVDYPISCDWSCHIARGNGELGGVDYAMAVGTPLLACSDGVLSNNPNGGTGGYISTITRPDHSKTQYMHLSKFTTPRAVKQGDIIGYSGGAKGAVGAGNSTGPHCHVDDVNPAGVRVPPFTTGGSSTASTGTVTPIKGTDLEMKLQRFTLGDQDFFYYPDGTLFHSPDAPHTVNLTNWYAPNILGQFNEAQVNLLFSGNSGLTFADALALPPGARIKK